LCNNLSQKDIPTVLIGLGIAYSKTDNMTTLFEIEIYYLFHKTLLEKNWMADEDYKPERYCGVS